MDWTQIAALAATIVGGGASFIGLIYMIIRNLKNDINSHIDKLSKRIDNIELRMNLLDERMFQLATGKSLADAIKEERMKKGE